MFGTILTVTGGLGFPAPSTSTTEYVCESFGSNGPTMYWYSWAPRFWTGLPSMKKTKFAIDAAVVRAGGPVEDQLTVVDRGGDLAPATSGRPSRP